MQDLVFQSKHSLTGIMSHLEGFKQGKDETLIQIFFPLWFMWRMGYIHIGNSGSRGNYQELGSR